MKTAILEIAPHGHYTYVESISQVFTAVSENEVVIFTNEKGREHLQHLENQQISLIVKPNTEGYDVFLKRIQNVDLLYVVTLEA